MPAMRILPAFILALFVSGGANLFGGAWGVGSFQNDDALDWVDNVLLVSRGISSVNSAVMHVANVADSSSIEMPECGAAIAACEVIAAWRKRPTLDLPEDVRAWVDSNPARVQAQLVTAAIKALDRLMKDSEMCCDWNDPKDGDAWRAGLKDLQERLRAADELSK